VAGATLPEASKAETPEAEEAMTTYWVVALYLAGSVEKPITMDNLRPTAAGAPQVSFLMPGCRLETTEGADWHRVFVNCGNGPHLLSEPSSLMWHVRIRTPEQALELVRLFTAPPDACQMIPFPRWVEINAHAAVEPNAERDSWLALDRSTFERVCPRSLSHEIAGRDPLKRFIVTRCLIGVTEDDGNLYSVEEHVMENGETEIVRKTVVLANARSRIGSCSPAAGTGPPSLRGSSAAPLSK
jgi:hypothetical protein